MAKFTKREVIVINKSLSHFETFTKDETGELKQVIDKIKLKLK